MVLASVLQVLVLLVLVLVILELGAAGQQRSTPAMRKRVEENRRGEEGSEPDTGECHPGTTCPTFRLAQPLFLNFCTFLFLYLCIFNS